MKMIRMFVSATICAAGLVAMGCGSGGPEGTATDSTGSVGATEAYPVTVIAASRETLSSTGIAQWEVYATHDVTTFVGRTEEGQVVHKVVTGKDAAVLKGETVAPTSREAGLAVARDFSRSSLGDTQESVDSLSDPFCSILCTAAEAGCLATVGESGVGVVGCIAGYVSCLTGCGDPPPPPTYGPACCKWAPARTPKPGYHIPAYCLKYAPCN